MFGPFKSTALAPALIAGVFVMEFHKSALVSSVAYTEVVGSEDSYTIILLLVFLSSCMLN